MEESSCIHSSAVLKRYKLRSFGGLNSPGQLLAVDAQSSNILSHMGRGLGGAAGDQHPKSFSFGNTSHGILTISAFSVMTIAI